MSDHKVPDRKADHLQLASLSQRPGSAQIPVDYEPLFAGHSRGPNDFDRLQTTFLGKKLRAPLWISSMTGGTGEAGPINRLLAQVAHEFELGFALGSCRPLLEDPAKHLADFDMRPILGEARPFFANLGVAQVDQILRRKEISKLQDVVGMLRADGLILHINPLQEALQPEGDRYQRPAIETIQELLDVAAYPIMVKEVGQGMGPRSLEALMRLPLAAVEFAGLGGTNFSKLELLRRGGPQSEALAPLVNVGHSAQEMVTKARELMQKLGPEARCRQFIISGGITSFVEGHMLVEQMRLSGAVAVYGQAYAFLAHARGSYEELREFVHHQLQGLDLCARFLVPRT